MFMEELAMWLARPVYESLPYAYIAIGIGAVALSYVDSSASQSTLAMGVGLSGLIAGLTIVLHRQACRRLRTDYSGAPLENPPPR
jgi:hypothetical protein